MTSLCCLLHLHLPPVLRHYTFFDIGASAVYEDAAAQRALAAAAAEQCLPANRLLLQLLREYGGDFRVAVSVSGTALDLLRTCEPAVVDSFRRLAGTGCVEFVVSPSHRSLAFYFSRAEFAEQVALHRQRLGALFGQAGATFHNTAFLPGNALTHAVEALGFEVLLADGAAPAGRPNRVLRPRGCRALRLLLRNPRAPGPAQPPAPRAAGARRRADPLARWLASPAARGDVVTLGLDYRDLGSPRSGEPLALDFLRALPAAVLRRPALRFQTPAEAARAHVPAAAFDAPDGAAQRAKDPAWRAWLGNELQRDAARTLYALEEDVRRQGSRARLNAWRRLQDAEHLRRMGHAGPGRPSPYEAYIDFMNALADLKARAGRGQPTPSTATRGGSAASRA